MILLFDNFEDNSCAQNFLKDKKKNEIFSKTYWFLQNFTYLEKEFKLLKANLQIVKNYINIENILVEIVLFESKFEYLGKLLANFPQEIYNKNNLTSF